MVGREGTKCQNDREHAQPNLAKSTKRSRSETRSTAIKAKGKSERAEAKKEKSNNANGI